MTWLNAAFLLFCVVSAKACRGYDIVVSNEVNCGGPANPVIKFVNRSFVVNNKCEIMSSSCSLIRPYKTAMLSLEIFDGTVQIYRTFYDLCSRKTKPALIMSCIVGWGIPSSCSIRENSEFCYDGSKVVTLPVSVQNMLQIFSISKVLKIRVKITHDTGKSCFESFCEVAKKPK